MFQLKDTLQSCSSSYLYILTARQYITAKMQVDATNNARPTPDHIRPEKGKCCIGKHSLTRRESTDQYSICHAYNSTTPPGLLPLSPCALRTARSAFRISGQSGFQNWLAQNGLQMHSGPDFVSQNAGYRTKEMKGL